MILYLWQNQKTVVIGRNQNAWKECSIRLLTEDGGHLARRLSGGGAVYHDLGNVNFTFLAKRENYDLSANSMSSWRHWPDTESPAVRSGRNDLVVAATEERFAGRKFSGNAFYCRGENAFHHGTIMLAVKKTFSAAILSPSLEKLAAKGVACAPASSTCKAWPRNCRFRRCRRLDRRPLRRNMAKDRRKLTRCPPKRSRRRLEDTVPNRGSWLQRRFFHRLWAALPPGGDLEIGLETDNGLITKAAVYSDAMDGGLIAAIAPRFQGLSADGPCCDRALAALEAQADAEAIAILQDIRQYLREQLPNGTAPFNPKDRP